MRELNKTEKELSKKSLDRNVKELDMHLLSKEIIEAELALLPKRQEIGLHNKKKELEQVTSNVSFLQDKINVLKKQIEEGVEEKNE